MTLTARDIMQSHVITVSPESPLLDVQRLFIDEEITGAPVVDDAGRLVGVVTIRDLLRAAEESHDSVVSETRYFRDDLEFSGPDWGNALEDFQDRLGGRSVGEVMTAGGITVAPDAPVAEVARTLRHHRIHRVLVAEADLLRGIISSFDLVALVEKESAG